MLAPSNPATLADVRSQDVRIPGLDPLVAGAERASLLVPVYDPETDTTYRTRLLGEDAAFDSNAVVGGPKLVQYRSSLLFGVPAGALTLDRLSPVTIVPGTTARVGNPSDTPLTDTKPAKQYVATRAALGTPGAVLVPAYIGAAQADTVPVVWVEVAAGSGGGSSAFADLTGVPADNPPLATALAGLATTLLLSPVRGTDGSLTADDLGHVVRVSSSYPVALTVPPGLGLPAAANTGRLCTVLSLGTGKVTLTFAAGVTPIYPSGSGPTLNGLGELSLLWVDTNTVWVKGGTT